MEILHYPSQLNVDDLDHDLFDLSEELDDLSHYLICPRCADRTIIEERKERATTAAVQ